MLLREPILPVFLIYEANHHYSGIVYIYQKFSLAYKFIIKAIINFNLNGKYRFTSKIIYKSPYIYSSSKLEKDIIDLLTNLYYITFFGEKIDTKLCLRAFPF
ncbi:hypothetical protein HMPREF9194_01267 [Treponema maltophilum ATCC 51939]|uniref:Uncharacterized protein n=1 Tax=Treponema maltophilum ATCC 51939 TaxID=1125699 RepID=S3K0A6_TREMA|nr:hypothetical protein HMPREF9194_01267 [Treponema maltophilum ATCC 51939]